MRTVWEIKLGRLIMEGRKERKPKTICQRKGRKGRIPEKA